MELELRETPRPALFLAARAYAQYRRRGGSKGKVLPDFFIGAHAALEGYSLVRGRSGVRPTPASTPHCHATRATQFAGYDRNGRPPTPPTG